MSVCFVRPSEQAEKNGVRPNSNSVGPFSWCFLCACSMFSAYSLMFCFHRNNKKTVHFLNHSKAHWALQAHTHARSLAHISRQQFLFTADPVNKTEQNRETTYHSAWLADGLVNLYAFLCARACMRTCERVSKIKTGKEESKEKESKRIERVLSPHAQHTCVSCTLFSKLLLLISSSSVACEPIRTAHMHAFI